MRAANVTRETKETSVQVELALNGTGSAAPRTGVKFLDHMLTTLSVHSSMNLEVRATGDLQHHLIEDVALTLGEAFSKALSERRGIRRFGHAIVPMDDALAFAAVDLVRRPYSSIQLNLEHATIEDISREDLEHFLRSLSTALEATIHIKVLEGVNDHHKVEAAFKALALALKEATTIESTGSTTIPSAKGVM